MGTPDKQNRFGAKSQTWFSEWEAPSFHAEVLLPDDKYASVKLMSLEEHAAEEKARAPAKNKSSRQVSYLELRWVFCTIPFSIIFQLRAPSNLLSAAVPAR